MMNRKDTDIQKDIRKRLLATIMGEEKPDLVIKNCGVLCVFTGEIIKTNIIIAGNRIACWNSGINEGEKTIEAEGFYAIPGLIDGHTHIESTMLTTSELARQIVPRGVTTIIADLHEMASLFGKEGVKVFMEEAREVPMRLYIQVPALLNNETAEDLLDFKEVVSFGEASLPRIMRDPEKFIDLYEKTRAHGKIITGHAASLNLGSELCALTALGHCDDHECATVHEAMDRIRMGQRVMIREGSAAKNLKKLIKVVLDAPNLGSRCLFCTDDVDVSDIITQGHMDNCVVSAVSEGVAPELSISMATTNCAEHHRLEQDLGSLAPGRFADIVLVPELFEIRPEKVIFDGELVAEKGKALWSRKQVFFPQKFYKSVNLGKIPKPEDLRLPLPENKHVRVRIIRIQPEQILKELDMEMVQVINGKIENDIERDILKIAVLERRQGTGKIGIGLVRGFGLKSGALASSIAHDEHDIVVVGATDEDIIAAVNKIHEEQGGLVVANEGKVTASVSLPVGGLISQLQAPELARELEMAKTEAVKLGCPLPAPFVTLSFIPLIGLPKIGISKEGLFDSASQKNVPLLLE